MQSAVRDAEQNVRNRGGSTEQIIFSLQLNHFFLVLFSEEVG
jgi:hypothetical protein